MRHCRLGEEIGRKIWESDYEFFDETGVMAWQK